MLELPPKLPNPDPVLQYRGEDGRRRTSEEQPYTYRLKRLGFVAEEKGRGIEFADEILDYRFENPCVGGSIPAPGATSP